MTQVAEKQCTGHVGCDRIHTHVVPRMVICAAFLAGFAMGWLNAYALDEAVESRIPEINEEDWLQTVVDRIVAVESNGEQTAANKRSTALGLGQFLDQTWLDLIRAYRSDLAKDRSKEAILELRRDGRIAREITALFLQKNTSILQKRGLAVTPGTLYLAHFAGPGGAVAVLCAVDGADAASTMANADATGRTTRETIVKANPFLKDFTVADLRRWADRKMRFPGSRLPSRLCNFGRNSAWLRELNESRSLRHARSPRRYKNRGSWRRDSRYIRPNMRICLIWFLCASADKHRDCWSRAAIDAVHGT